MYLSLLTSAILPYAAYLCFYRPLPARIAVHRRLLAVAGATVLTGYKFSGYNYRKKKENTQPDKLPKMSVAPLNKIILTTCVG